MTLGVILPAHRRWCRVLYSGKVEWYRTREWAETTICNPPARRNPTYAMVERMRDVGLFYWKRIEREDGTAYFKATLTELGEVIGATPQPQWELKGTPACTMHETLREAFGVQLDTGEKDDGKE